jgi:cytochrome b involved in lipid metabolism
MKLLVTLATLVFCAAVVGVKLMAAGTPQAASTGPLQAARTAEQPSIAAAPAGSAAPAAAAAQPSKAQYTLADVARHADAKSCWMAIEGGVYDFTAYLPRHPADPKAMLRHCGREASEAFRTKDAGRPHSPNAAQLMADYRIGTLRR